MRGYIREYRPNKWSYTIYIGKLDGKPKKKEKGGFNSKSEAEKELAIKLAELSTTGEIFVPTEKTLEVIFNEFIQSAPLTRRPSTIVKHKSIWEHHIKNAIGFMPIKSIKTSHIDKLIQSKVAAEYSEQFVKSIFKSLFAQFEYALNQGYIKVNPMLKAVNPKVTRKPIETFTLEELQRIGALLRNSNLYTSFIIGINTGMRVSEVFGLRWKDIDFGSKTISVNHQLIYEKGRYCIAPTKTDSGTRTIKMTKQLLDYLKELKNEQTDNQSICHELWKTNKVFNYFTNSYEVITDFVNIKKDGEFLTANSVKYIARVCKDAGIKFNFHNLRHTHATMLLENGASIKMVQERLGHARPEITLNLYIHVTNKFSDNILNNFSIDGI